MASFMDKWLKRKERKENDSGDDKVGAGEQIECAVVDTVDRPATLDAEEPVLGVEPVATIQDPEREDPIQVEPGNEEPPKKCLKQARRFNTSWQINRSWLKKLPGRDAMICDLCSRHASAEERSKFPTWTVDGCTTMRLLTVKSHERTSLHESSVRAESTVAGIIQRGGISHTFQQVAGLNRQAIIGALRTMYWICKEELPHTTKFQALLQFAESMGCGYLKHLRSSTGYINYTSEQAKQEFVRELAETIRSEKMEEMMSSAKFGLLVDESTDVSNTKQLIVYARYLDARGEAKTSFLDMVEVADGRAETIKCAVVKSVEERGLDMEKAAGLGSDGASVMVGRENGVAAKLKATNPALISVHCVAHRLALGVAQAAAAVPYVVKYKRMLQQLYAFYSSGPVRTAGLREIQKILEEPVLKLREAKDVRWLSHHAAVVAIQRTLGSVITSLERESSERGDAQARGLATMVKTFHFAATTAMMCDILPEMSTLSKFFQKSDLDFTAIDPHVTAAKANLQRCTGGRGKFMTGLKDWMDTLPGVEVFEDAKLDSFIKSVNDPFVESLLRNLDRRFEDSSILLAYRAFEPSSAHTPIMEDDIQTLCTHFSMDVDAVGREWNHMRQIAATHHRSLNLQQFLRELATKYSDIAPHLATMASAALVVPVTTADCERGFSAMNRLKTKARNRIATMLVPLMWIAVEGPEYEDTPASFFETTADSWSKRSKRRLTL